MSNNGTQTYKTDTLRGTFTAAGAFGAAGKATIEDDDHGHGGGGYGNNDRGHGGNGGSKDQKATFEAVGIFGLAGVTTQQVLTPDGWKNPVTNNASITNVGNNFSGNAGLQQRRRCWQPTKQLAVHRCRLQSLPVIAIETKAPETGLFLSPQRRIDHA